MIFYAALEGLGYLDVANEYDNLGYDGDVQLKGHTLDLGDFTIDITRGPETNSYPPRRHPSYDEKPLNRTIVSTLQVPADALWEAKSEVSLSLQLPNGCNY